MVSITHPIRPPVSVTPTPTDPDRVLQLLNIPPVPAGAAIGRTFRMTAGPSFEIHSPIDGRIFGSVKGAEPHDVHTALTAAESAFAAWRTVPAPHRGEFVRRIGQTVRHHKTELAELISWEVGKITQEALGEVQEWIDICDYAVGLSRQLQGLTLPSERPGHRIMEQWHPLGPIGIITAFNFPVAVWAWNAMIALVCGNSILWKPSEKAPLCALACHELVGRVLDDMPDVPPEVVNLVIGDAHVGALMAASDRLPLISATGSVSMGRTVATLVAQRLGRSLLELGGNNALILTPSADLDLALRAVVFSAVGTCGQRCTTLRRLIVHNSLRRAFTDRLIDAYAPLPIGNPLSPGTLVGPLIDEAAFNAMEETLSIAREQRGIVHFGQRVTDNVPPTGFYVHPALVEIPPDAPILAEETFAPILYISGYDTLEQAIALNNAVPQGLSSAIFTTDIQEAELFLSAAGSDCGLANVNIGTSGAEIGAAFGGEKQTGGGRESGSDAWKNYMRRTTNTINYSRNLPLAQGISFEL